MSHTPNPIYEDKSGRTTFSLVFTILITGGVFLIIPLTQLSSQNPPSGNPDDHYSIFIQPPPDPPKPPEKQEPDEKPEDPPEMDHKHDKLSITEIGNLLNNLKGRGPNQFYTVFNPEDFQIDTPIFNPEDLDIAPRSILTASPIYPPELKRAGVEGSVEVIYIVTPKGNVTNIRITDATHREFAESVRGALRRWSFEPGKKDNQDVSTRVRQSFGFNLQ